MKFLNFKPLSFNARIFLCLVVMMSLFTASLYYVFIQDQKKMLVEKHIAQGKMMASLLADNARLGVFSEDEDRLKYSVSAVLDQDDVLEVLVFNMDWKLLNRDYGPSQVTAVSSGAKPIAAYTETVAAMFSQSWQPVYLADRDRCSFWAPVLARIDNRSEEDFYFNGGSVEPVLENLIGYVGISVSKDGVDRGIETILVRSAEVAMILLFGGIVITFFLVREATRPLDRLMHNVKAHGINVCRDDLGMLEDRYSQMVETIAESFETINDLKLGLEEKVEERTRDLMVAYDELGVREQNVRTANEKLSKTLAELQQTQAHLVHSEKMAAVGRMVAGVAHEVNNPINFITSAMPGLRNNLDDIVAILRRHESEENGSFKENRLIFVASESDSEKIVKEIKTLLGFIEEGARRVSGIVTDLSAFSRVDESAFTKVDINEGLDRTIAILAYEWAHRIEIKKEYEGGLPHVSGIPGQLFQVFTNILVNAIYAIPDQGIITVRTWHDKGRVHIAFRDNGEGIPEDVRKKIFDPFFTTKPPGKGTGLGLGISYGIVKGHNGEIIVTSEVGKGTEFEVILPV